MSAVRVRPSTTIREWILLKWFSQLWLFAPVLVGVLLMLPRLAAPEFGLFDDGLTLKKAHEIARGVWDLEFDEQAGRSRPVYWLLYTLIFYLFGQQPFWFFLVNTLLLACIVLSILYLVRANGGSQLQASLSGLFFVLASPVIENFYTLSKGEPLQLALLGASLLLMIPIEREKRWWVRSILVAASASAIFISAVTKETSLLVLPISLGWLLTAWLAKRFKGIGLSPAPRLAYLFSAALGLFAFLGYRWFFVTRNLVGGTYTNGYIFEAASIAASAVRWAGWLFRDFLYIVPVAVVVFAWSIRRRSAPQSMLLLDAAIWMAAWIAVFLPWAFAVDYYLLPFAAGFAVAAGWAAVRVLDLLSQPDQRWRLVSAAALGSSFLLLLASLANNLTTLRLQLAVDTANARMLDAVAATAPQDSTVLVNIQLMNEYIPQIRYHLNIIRDRPDLEIDQFEFQVLEPESPDFMPHLILSPDLANQPLMTVRMGQVEATQKGWNTTMRESLDEDWQVVFENEESFRLLLFDYLRLLCPVTRGLDYCTADRPLIDRRVFNYGWTVYQLEKP